MLLERTLLERRLAEIVATNMPGHGGDGLGGTSGGGTTPPDRDAADDDDEQPPEDPA